MPFARRISRILLGALLALALVPGIAGAIPRDQVMARARMWVDREVPYSTPLVWPPKYYADEKGDLVDSLSGWRTDCSGFVSMCWNLRESSTGAPVAPNTTGLPARCVKIAKSDLLSGDAMINPRTHTFIFERWVDASMTEMVVWEEPNSEIGKAITRTRKWSDLAGYSCYRYKLIDPDYGDVQAQVSGANRYETAVAAVGLSFPTTTTVSVPVVVLASGATWPDALGGAALAGAFKGPLLLTNPTALPWATRASIVRLKPETVFVLGGEEAVSATVVSAVESMGVSVTRIDGSNRYAVSSAIARTAVEQARRDKHVVDTAYLSTGLNFPDALAASPVSARTLRPILLTEKASLTPSTRLVLRELGIKNVIILGGTESVSPAVETQLKAAGISVSRIEGATRYNTAINIAHHGVELGDGMSWKSLGLASGDSFADALSGGVAQGQSGTGSLVLLTPGSSLNSDVSRELEEHKDAIGLLRIFGGSSVVQLPTRAAAAVVLRAP